MSEIWWIIIGGAILTYAARIGGYLVVARFETVPPRLDAALNAVPAAVLTTIAVPAFVDGPWPEKLVLAAAGLAALRFPNLLVIAASTAVVAGFRAYGM